MDYEKVHNKDQIIICFHEIWLLEAFCGLLRLLCNNKSEMAIKRTSAWINFETFHLYDIHVKKFQCKSILENFCHLFLQNI